MVCVNLKLPAGQHYEYLDHSGSPIQAPPALRRLITTALLLSKFSWEYVITNETLVPRLRKSSALWRRLRSAAVGLI